jgi:hypothetical protein
MAGIEQRGGQPQPEQPRQSDQTQPLQGRATGRESLQGPTTVDRSEQLQPMPGSALSRSVERMRELYERNGWIFLPLGESGKPSLNLSISTTEHPTSSDQERNQTRTLFIGCGIPPLPDDLFNEEDQQFRDEIEPMSDDEMLALGSKIHKEVEEDLKRWDEKHPRRLPQPRDSIKDI